MTKRERQLLSCLSTCLAAPFTASEGDGAFATILGALGRMLGAPVLTFGLQETATRRVLFSAKAETNLADEEPDTEVAWAGIPSDTGGLRSLFRVVPVGDGQHRILLGGMADVPDDPYHRAVLAELAPRL